MNNIDTAITALNSYNAVRNGKDPKTMRLTLAGPDLETLEYLGDEIFKDDAEILRVSAPQKTPAGYVMYVTKRLMSIEIQTITDTEFVVNNKHVTVYPSGDAWLTNPVLEGKELRALREHITALNKSAVKIG